MKYIWPFILLFAGCLEPTQTRTELRDERDHYIRESDRLREELATQTRRINEQLDEQARQERRRRVEAAGGRYWEPSAPLMPSMPTESN